jgi:hypothetical protein
MKTTGKRVVGKTEYAARKTLAVSLSSGVFACGVGTALLLISLPYAHHLDEIEEASARILQGRPPDYKGDLDLLYSYFGIAVYACKILIPVLAIGALILWLASRQSWNTIRVLQPIDRANNADMPAYDSLVRASDLPVHEQETELLRATIQGSETPNDQLVRPTR